jgi:uncharacterized protein DUF4395
MLVKNPTTMSASTPSNTRRNFILQQGLCEPAAATCSLQYSALLFQPRLVGITIVVAVLLQSPIVFFALAAVLWFSALAPRLNPFDALYNAMGAGITLTPAPPPRRFAQFLAGSFAFAIGMSLVLDRHTIALMLEVFFITAVAALLFFGFCLGSFIFHLLRGRADFAKRTLPWASGALIISTALISGAWSQSLTVEQQYSVPDWANRVLEHPDFQKQYEMDAHLNPFCQRADFDGDGKADFAVFVRERSSGKIGIAFIHRNDAKMYIVGAGKPGVHGDDYSWIDAWIVYDKGVVFQGAEEGAPPKLRGDGLLIFKTESASAILWWNGREYRWYQQGD